MPPAAAVWGIESVDELDPPLTTEPVADPVADPVAETLPLEPAFELTARLDIANEK